jgi:hypothetical protein
MAKPPKTIQEQIALLKGRNMAFRNETEAVHFLSNISYYRLKGYWWEMQKDKIGDWARACPSIFSCLGRKNYTKRGTSFAGKRYKSHILKP